jgi:hypothetical protein
VSLSPNKKKKNNIVACHFGHICSAVGQAGRPQTTKNKKNLVACHFGHICSTAVGISMQGKRGSGVEEWLLNTLKRHFFSIFLDWSAGRAKRSG